MAQTRPSMITRFMGIPPWLVLPARNKRRSGLGEGLQGGADRLAHRHAGGQALHRGERFLVAVAEGDQRVQHVRGLLAGGAGGGLGEPALELEQQALGGLLADAGHAHQRRSVLQRHGLGEVAHRKAREHRERGARADTGDADQLAERRALLQRGEAIQRVRVLAHHEVRKKADRLAARRQAVERAHRHVDLVGHAADVDQHLRRLLGDQAAGKPADQTRRPLFIFNPWWTPRRWPCAWQIAHASASAASGAGSPGSASRRFTMCCTCSLAAWPLPTTDCLTCSAVYSATGRPASTAAQIAVPRAWPRARVDCGLVLTNTFSTATCPGAWASMTSFSPSRITLSRAARSPSPDLTQPLAT